MRDGLEYLEDNPNLWQWMNRCPACGAIGYKPELPEFGGTNKNVGAASRDLRNLFACLPICEDGRCERCHEKRELWQRHSESYGIDE